MRFIRIRGMLTAAALLAVLPAHGQNATAPAATAPATPPTAQTLTPPGSATSVPLLPDASATPPGALPGSTALPGGGLSSPAIPEGTLPGGSLPSGGMMPSPGLPTGLSMPGFSGMGGLGQTQDLTTILAGSTSMPLTLTLGELDSHWRRMTVSGNLDLGSLNQVVAAMMGSAGLGVYYTKGETVSVGDATYLVAYSAHSKLLDMTAMADSMGTAGATPKPPAADKLTPETPLALSLLNLSTIGSLTDIRPFNLQAELAQSAAAARSFNSMIGSLGAAAMSMATAPHPAIAH